MTNSISITINTILSRTWLAMIPSANTCVPTSLPCNTESHIELIDAYKTFTIQIITHIAHDMSGDYIF